MCWGYMFSYKPQERYNLKQKSNFRGNKREETNSMDKIPMTNI